MTTTACPICGAKAEELLRIGDFHGFKCPTHDEFEVADYAMSMRLGKASLDRWERALGRAKRHNEYRGESGKRPQIRDHDFI